MQFLFAEEGKKEEFSTRSVDAWLFIHITPEVKIVILNTEEELVMGTPFIAMLDSPTSHTSVTKIFFLCKLTAIRKRAITQSSVMLAFSQTNRAEEN